MNQSAEKSFMIDYELNGTLPWEECPDSFDVELNGVRYEGRKFAPRPRPPELGEEIEIKVVKTRFKIKPPQVRKWLEHFGRITKEPAFEDALDLPEVKCDDIVMKAVLRKHIPGILPAYGRRMNIRYHGQPIVCGKCFEIGHVRRNCEKPEVVKWADFVKVVSEMPFVSREMLGDWAELLKKE